MKAMRLFNGYIPRSSLGAVVLLLLVLLGCNKSERDLDTETLSSREHALAMQIFEGLFREVHKFSLTDSITNTQGFSFNDNNCIASARFNKSRADFPVILTMVYDSNECVDEVVRKGQIRAEYSGKYLEKGSSINIDLRNYIVGEMAVDGEMIIENRGQSSGNWVFSWKVIDGSVTGFNTDISWEGSHTMSWVDGLDSKGNPDDDVFYITQGNATGRNSRGNSFSTSITSRLTSDYECKWFTTGRFKMQVSNLIDRTATFGEGDCDAAFTVRRNNTYFEVEIDY